MMRFLLTVNLVLFILSSSPAQTFQRACGTTAEDYSTDVLQTSDKGFAVMGVSNGKIYLLKMDSLGTKQWSRSFSLVTPSPTEFRSFSQTSDSGFILCGVINYSNNNHGFLLKTDASGNVSWMKMHVALNRLFSIKQTSDGGYAAVGSSYFGSAGALVKFTPNGDLHWSRTLKNGSASTLGMDLVQLKSDSSYIVYYKANSSLIFARYTKSGVLSWSKNVAGATGSPGTADCGHLYENGSAVQVAAYGSCPGVLSIEKNGSYGKMIGTSCQLYAYKVVDACPSPAGDKSFFFAGYYNLSVSAFSDQTNLVIASIDSSGVLKWAKQIGGINYEFPAAIKRTKDKGAALAGYTKSFSSGYKDIYFIKTDSLGQSGCHTSALNFTTAVANVTLTNFAGTLDTLFNNVGSLQTATVSTPSEIINDVCVCIPPVASFTADPSGIMQDNSTWADKWYWTCTCTSSVDSTSFYNKSYYGMPAGSGTYTVCLKVKNSCGVDSTCQQFNYSFFPIGVNENQIDNNRVYPNPVADKLIITRSDSQMNSTTELRILNSTGQLIHKSQIESTQSEISFREVSSGLYFVQLIGEGKTVTHKVIKP